MIRRAALLLLILALFGCLSGLLAYRPAQAEPNAALTDNLVACWTLNETSGTRSDAVGSNHLTDNNTVGYAGGVVDNAASFVAANSEYLSINDNAALSTGDIDYTIAAWVYLDATGKAHGIASKFGTGGSREYRLEIDTANKPTFAVSGDGTAYTTVTGEDALSGSEWYYLVAWHDSSGNTLSIQTNNGTPASTAHSSGSYDTGAAFIVGARNVSTGLYMDGRVDGLVIWKRVLTSDERAWLYNSGSGRSCSEIGTNPTPTPTNTNTPAPTATATGTVTPTPSGELRVTLDPGGNWMTVKRDISYGDVGVVIAVAFLIVIVLIAVIIFTGDRWLR
jgi:hypothetical protein